MARLALLTRDGVVKAHGFCTFTMEPGETIRAVPDDFALRPHHWRFDGVEFVAITPPEAPHAAVRAELRAHLMDMKDDVLLPAKLRALVDKLSRVF